MNFLDCTLPTVAENLALDEAMLLLAEEGQFSECLRLWDATSCFVVLGRGSKHAIEVNLAQASFHHIPVFRRISGGATVLAAPGCMFYSALLSLDERPHLRMLDQAHQFVMGRVQAAVAEFLPTVQLQGTCDLTLDNKKVSGNSLRIARDWVLYHGTLLLEMDLSLVDQYLRHPPREPDYREKRSHGVFVQNLGIARHDLAQQLVQSWDASMKVSLDGVLQSKVTELVSSRYSLDSWNLSR
ncbi:MAG: lipoate--protein ligase family protein [Planctomycetota bacterium]